MWLLRVDDHSLQSFFLCARSCCKSVSIIPPPGSGIASDRLRAADFEHPTTYIIFNFTPVSLAFTLKRLLLFTTLSSACQWTSLRAFLLNGLSGRQFLAGHQGRSIVKKQLTILQLTVDNVSRSTLPTSLFLLFLSNLFPQTHPVHSTNNLLLPIVNCQLNNCQLVSSGEYRSRTDDLLLAKQAL